MVSAEFEGSFQHLLLNLIRAGLSIRDPKAHKHLCAWEDLDPQSNEQTELANGRILRMILLRWCGWQLTLVSKKSAAAIAQKRARAVAVTKLIVAARMSCV
jgi:hypothetical protein